ncbi:unnamed protein product [Sphagnum tenellum]
MGMSCKLMEPLKEEYCSSKSAAGAGYCERVVHYLATLLVTANNSSHNKGRATLLRYNIGRTPASAAADDLQDSARCNRQRPEAG